MPRRKGDTTLQTVRAVMNPVPEIPAFLEISKAARDLWPFFVSARDTNQWGKVELVLLARACTLEVDLARCRAQLDKMGYVIKDRNGEVKPNPIVKMLAQFSREQMTIFSRLSLGYAADQAKGKKAGNIYDGNFSRENGADLLERPRHR